MTTSQRIGEFQAIDKAYTEEELLLPVGDNDTRWFSTYLMLIRAIKIKDSLDLFVSRHMKPRTRGEKHLSGHVMRKDDWDYCNDVLAFMSPLYFLKELEGESQSGKLFRSVLFIINFSINKQAPTDTLASYSGL